MTIQEFFDKWNNKPADFDGYYGNQCVDIIQYYNKDIFGGGFIPGQGAADIWETYPVEIYERVLNTPTAIPVKGNIMIWRKTTSLPFGHIGIFNEGNVNRFTSFDQNWPIGSLCHFQEHDYTGVIGWLRPIKQPIGNITTPLLNEWEQKLKIYNSVFYKPEDVINFINERKGEITKLNGVINDKDTTINNLNGQIAALEKDKNILADELKICQQAGEVNLELNDKLIQITQEYNQLRLDHEQLRSNWSLKEVALNKQIALLTTKYQANKSSIKKLLIDYIFGKTI